MGAQVQMVQEAEVFESESEPEPESEMEEIEEEEEEEETEEPLTLNRRRMPPPHTPSHSKSVLLKGVQVEEPARKSQPGDPMPIKRTYGPVPRVTRSQSVVPTVTPVAPSSTPNSAKRRGSNATLLKIEGKRKRSKRR